MFADNNVSTPKQVCIKTGHLELLTAPSHFSALAHVLFFPALFLPEDVWELSVYLCISLPSGRFLCAMRSAFEYHSPMFTVIIGK